MKPLFEKQSAQGTWTFLLSKFGTLFNRVTGYDLMFEASRSDIKISGKRYKATGPKTARDLG